MDELSWYEIRMACLVSIAMIVIGYAIISAF